MTEYRMLKEGEVVQEGDEYKCLHLGRWWPTNLKGSFVNRYLEGDYRRPIEAKKGTGMFTEETVTKKIVDTVNGVGPGYCLMSVKGADDGWIELVVDARWEDRCAHRFSKRTLGQLIEELQDIHSVMKDSK